MRIEGDLIDRVERDRTEAVVVEVRGLLAAHKQDLTIFAPDGSAAASLLDLVRLPHVTDKAAQNSQS